MLSLAKYNILFGNQIFHALQLQMIQISSFSISYGWSLCRKTRQKARPKWEQERVVRASFPCNWTWGSEAFHLKLLWFESDTQFIDSRDDSINVTREITDYWMNGMLSWVLFWHFAMLWSGAQFRNALSYLRKRNEYAQPIIKGNNSYSRFVQFLRHYFDENVGGMGANAQKNERHLLL